MKRKLTSQLLYFLSAASAAVTFFVFIFIVAHILAKGLPNIRLSSFDFKYTAENLSMLPACINTLVTVAAVVAFSLPLSVMAAVYLTEYSNDNIAAKLINAAIDTLAAVPSIIYGLFGYLCFSVKMNFGFSFISGVATLSLMVLPIIVNSTQAAINSVSNAVRDGGAALGAGRAKTSLRLILPAAKTGYNIRCDIIGRKNHGRDCSTYLYYGQQSGNNKRAIFFRKDIGGTYIRSLL